MRAIVRIIFSLLLIISSVSAQEANKRISMHDLSGGLNVADNMSLIKDNEAQTCTNIILDSLIGGIASRTGMSAISMYGLPSKYPFRSLYPFIDGNGRSFLLYTRYDDYNNADYLYYNTNDSFYVKRFTNAIDNADLSVFPHIGNWSLWNGRAYYFDGRSTGKVVYHGTQDGPDDLSLDFVPPPAPGQPIVKPYSRTTPGTLDGEYVYGLVIDVPCSTSYAWATHTGTLTPPIKLDKEYAYLTCFPYDIDDTLCTADTIARIMIVRSLANRYGYYDSLFVVDTIASYTPWTEYYVDTMSDATLHDTTKFMRIFGDYAYSIPIAYRKYKDKNAAPGAPRFISGGAATSVTDTVNNYYSSKNGYCVSFYNPETLLESDTSRSTWVSYAAGPTYVDSIITISLPRLPDSVKDYKKIIYRARLEEIVHGWYNMELIISDWMPIDTVDGSVLTYTDKLPHTHIDTVATPYTRQVLDRFINGAIIHEAKMFAWSDDRIYLSNTDSVKFLTLNNYEVDLFDGDKIQGLQSFAGQVLVYKTNSVWSLFTQDGEVYDRKKRLNGVGAVGPNAYTEWNGNAIFLSKIGVFMATEGEFKDNYLSRQHISRNVDNLLLRDPADMADIKLFVNNNKLFVSIPGQDTTFVYHFLTGGWSIWTIEFNDACIFDTLLDPTEYKTMLMGSLNTDNLLMFNNTATTDTGIAFTATWEKRYMGFEPGLDKYPVYFDLYGDTTGLLRWTPMLSNDNGTVFSGWGISLSSYNAPSEYWHFAVPQSVDNTGHWFNLKLQYNLADTIKAKIYGFDILTRDVGLSEPDRNER